MNGCSNVQSQLKKNLETQMESLESMTDTAI